ncbi:TPA: hypothetical protein N0F65_006528 [Lagenidium giganteum]|uniref:Uncharacterized protein n=1 Tax=Lagenidium giganteum TaxID=4803 RepID=A0AAV2YK85_9STRA|nr:TPA: hypothetical protein N0F65_006528 [Lagenidium giganteum]
MSPAIEPPWIQERTLVNDDRRLTSSSSGASIMVSKASEIGTSVRNTIKKFRGGNQAMYEHVISAVKIKMCDADAATNEVRFVPSTDAYAYTNQSGKCVQVLVTDITPQTVSDAYNNGMCEVKPNCYWTPIKPGDTDRVPAYKSADVKNADTAMQDWGTGFVTLVAPGIVLAVLSLLTMILYPCCACCCRCCHSRKDGYSGSQKFLPVFFFLVFSAAVFACAGVANTQRDTLTSAIGAIFGNTSGTLGDTSSWINQIQMPLEEVRDSVVGSAGDVGVAISGTSFVDNGVADLTGRLTDFKKGAADRTLPDGCTVGNKDPYCLPCLVCTTITTEVGKAQSQIESNAGDGVKKLKDVRDQLQNLLVAKASDVRNQVDTQVKNLNVFIETIKKTRTQVDDYRATFDKYKDMLSYFVLGLFGLAAATIVIGLIGVIFGLTPLKCLAHILHLAYFIGFLALIFTFLVSAAFLAASVLMGDACEITLIFEKDWTPVLGTEANGFNACFQNESLIEVFNLSSNLKFARGGLDFPQLQLDKMLDFSTLESFAATIQSTNESTFNLNVTVLNTSLALFNQQVGQNGVTCKPNDAAYTTNNILEPWSAHGDAAATSGAAYVKARYSAWDTKCMRQANNAPFQCLQPENNPCNFSAFVGELYHQVSSLRMVQRDSSKFIDALHQNISKVMDFGTEFKRNIRSLTGKVDTIKTNLTSSLIKSVETFEETMYCTFLAEDFDKIYGALCGDLLSALSTIALMLFVSGVLLIPVNICLIIACKRLTASNRVAVNEMKIIGAGRFPPAPVMTRHALSMCRLGVATLMVTALASQGAVAGPLLRTIQASNPWLQRRLGSTAGSSTGNAALDNAVAKANAIGSSVRDTIKKLRGGNEQLYQNVIDALTIEMCDHLVTSKTGTDSPKTRYVDSTDPLAYKFDNGSCVKIQLTNKTDVSIKNAYAQGKCEVKPNCYWGPINYGDVDREPVYAGDEAVPAPKDAMSIDDAKQALIKWGTGLMAFVVPGIILAVLSFLTMFFFLICRCCCNRCGGRSPREGGYSCGKKLLPVFFFILFSAAVVACAGVALLYQKTFTNAIGDMFTETETTLTDTSDWINRIQMPLEDFRDKIVGSAADVSVALNDTAFVDNGVSDLTGRLADFKKESADRTLPEGCTVGNKDPYCLPCLVCTTITTEVGKAQSQIETNAGDGVGKLKNIRDQLKTLLVAKAKDARDQVNAQVDNLDVFITTINTTRDQITTYHTQFDDYKKPLQLAVLGLFALSLVTIVLGLVGVLFGLTPLKFLANIIHIAYIIGFIALIITFLISSVFLAVSVLMGDACEITLIFEKDWTPVLGKEAKGFNACFRNESLITTFNLEGNLKFARGGLDFPKLDLQKMLDFSTLESFADTIQATNESAFNLNVTVLNTSLALFNQQVGQNGVNCKPNDAAYTMDNILEPWTARGDAAAPSGAAYVKTRYSAWDAKCVKQANNAPFQCAQPENNPCNFSAFVGELYHQVSSLRMVQRDSSKFIDALHQNISKVIDFDSKFKNNITKLTGKINTIETDLGNSVIKSVQTFEERMYCTFLADDFNIMYNSLCGDLMPALTMISLTLFFSAVFLIPVTICLIIAVKRLKARGNGTAYVTDNEMKFK